VTKTASNTQVSGNGTYHYIVLIVISFAVYANSLNNQFVYDDESVVLGDPGITSVSNIPAFFTGEMGFHKVIGAYFRPVVSASYAVDHALWGFKPFGFHLTNVLIHTICVLLLYKLLVLVFADINSRFKDYIILFAAGIFAVHPVHTEVVSWVSGRTDGLACLFFILAFIFYLKYSKSLRVKDMALTGVFYLLSLFSKEMAITFPAVVLIYELISNKKGAKKILLSFNTMYIFLIVVSVFYLLYRYYVLSGTTPRQSYIYFYGKDSATALFTMLQTIPLYLRLLVLPYGLLYHYSGYLPDISSPFDTGALIAIGVIAALVFAVYRLRNKLPQVSFGLLLFLITLLPVMNIIPTPNFMAERFLYIPSISLSFALCALAINYTTAKNSYSFLGTAIAVLIVFGYLTIARNTDWQTNDTLFMSAIGKQGVVTYVNLGNISARNGSMDEAELYFRRAIDLRPETVIANNNLGKIFMVKGNYDSAYFYIHKAHLLDSLSPEPVSTLAELNQKFGKYPEAIIWLERLNKMAPNYMSAGQRLAELRALNSKQFEKESDSTDVTGKETINVSARITELEQSSGINYNNKKYDRAIEEMKELIELNPARSAVYYSNIGMCYLERNMLQEAKENFLLSARIDPGFATAYNNLGSVYEKSGDLQKAKESYEKALTLDPSNQLAKQRLENIR
jgi:protein O-mannosyl-transferase